MGTQRSEHHSEFIVKILQARLELLRSTKTRRCDSTLIAASATISRTLKDNESYRRLFVSLYPVMPLDIYREMSKTFSSIRRCEARHASATT